MSEGLLDRPAPHKVSMRREKIVGEGAEIYTHEISLAPR